MHKYDFINLWTPVYDSPGPGVSGVDLDAFVPEHWANESLAILIENMVIGNLVHTDFKNEIARYGDVVNTRKPSTFKSKRKNSTEDVTKQDASAINVQVKLNQHHHVSFVIKDGDDTVAFKDLVQEFLSPAVIAIAQEIDMILLGQAVQFEANLAGHLGLLGSSNAKDYILDARQVMNENKAPMIGRQFILSPGAETSVLKDDDFTAADKVGDDGTALREASLGRKLGFNFYMCQNAASYDHLDVVTAGGDTLSGGNLTPGSTALTMADSSDVDVGSMVVVVGDDIPQRVTANNGTTEVITVTPGLKRTVDTAAIVRIHETCLVKQATTTVTEGSDGSNTGLRLGWHKDVIVDDVTANRPPIIGQAITIGTASVAAAADEKYTITDVTYVAGETSAILILDRPLDAALVDNAIVSLYPSGNYNLAFHRNAIALVSRPLAQPRPGTGALSAVVNYNGIGIRVVITYDGTAQGHLVTVDLLLGVKVLDTDLGVVMLG